VGSTNKSWLADTFELLFCLKGKKRRKLFLILPSSENQSKGKVLLLTDVLFLPFLGKVPPPHPEIVEKHQVPNNGVRSFWKAMWFFSGENVS